MFGVNVRNAFKLYDRVEDKWYLLVCRCLADKTRWLRAFDAERQRVNDDRANGFTVDSLKRPATSNRLAANTRSAGSSNRYKGSTLLAYTIVPETFCF